MMWLAFGACLLIALAFNYSPCQLDDAFITYRYAVHLAEHGTLAFNLGERPVEGFSSPLWLSLLAFFAACFGKAALPKVAFGLGISFAVGACLVAYRASSHLLLPRPEEGRSRAMYAGLSSATLLVACPALPYYAATGLEPMAFLFLTVTSLAALTGALPTWAGVAAASALPWARPEAAVFPLIWVIVYGFDRGLVQRRRLLLAVCGFCLSLSVLLGLRLAIFGDLLPNTYYAKLPDRLRGLQYVIDLLSTSWAGSLVFLGALGAACGGRIHKAWLVTAAIFLVVAAGEGGDWMPLGRFAIPAFGALAVAASGLFATRSKGAHAAAALAGIVALYGSYERTSFHLTSMHNARRTLTYEYQWFSSWLEQTPARSIALMDIGLVGFQNDIAIVDLAGLTDRTLARMSGHHLRKKIDPAYIIDKRPDLVVVRVEKPPFSTPGSFDPNAAMTQIEADLLASTAMSEQYVVVMMMLPPPQRAPYYGKLVFARHDLAIPKQLLPTMPIVSLKPLPE
jgi:hypothetical protein